MTRRVSDLSRLGGMGGKRKRGSPTVHENLWRLMTKHTIFLDQDGWTHEIAIGFDDCVLFCFFFRSIPFCFGFVHECLMFVKGHDGYSRPGFQLEPHDCTLKGARKTSWLWVNFMPCFGWAGADRFDVQAEMERAEKRVCLKSITSVEDLLRIFSSVEVKSVSIWRPVGSSVWATREETGVRWGCKKTGRRSYRRKYERTPVDLGRLSPGRRMMIYEVTVDGSALDVPFFPIFCTVWFACFPVLETGEGSIATGRSVLASIFRHEPYCYRHIIDRKRSARNRNQQRLQFDYCSKPHRHALTFSTASTALGRN